MSIEFLNDSNPSGSEEKSEFALYKKNEQKSARKFNNPETFDYFEIGRVIEDEGA